MAVAAVEPITEKTGFVSWGAIIAGALLAGALSFVFLTFGAAVGLSLVSPHTSDAQTARWVAGLAAFWVLAQQIASFLVGGYVAGRLRSRWQELKPDEIEFRDGMHGAIVWAIGVLLGALLAVSAAESTARIAAEGVGRAASAVASQADPLSYQVDVLLRSAGTNAAAPNPAEPAATRAEVLRIFANAATTGSMSPADKNYLAQLVAQRTGLPPQEAEARVNQGIADATRMAKDAADQTRKATVSAGFVTAASLLLSLAAAWWAAQRGGHHRDTSRLARFF